MAEKTIRLKRTTRLAKEGSFLAGAGRDERLPVGILTSDSRRHRAYLQLQDNAFPSGFWDEMFRLDDIELWAYKVGYFRVDAGTSAQVRVRRTTAREAEGTSDTLSSTNGGGSVWPGPATHAGSEVRGPVLPDASGRWVKVATITSLGRTWAPSRLGGSGTSMFGLVMAQDNDDWSASPSYTATVNNAEFASDDWGDGSKAPYLKFKFSDNQPPSAPAPTSPEFVDGGSSAVVVGTTAGTDLTVEFLYSDPDGDAIRRVEMEVYGDGETSVDPAVSARLATTDAVTPTPLGPLNAYRVRLTGLPARTTMRARLRVQDVRDAWSDWTLLTDGRFTTAYVPGAPLQSLMQTDPDRPDIFGTLNTPDANDFVTGWEGEFYRDTPQGRITLWAPGMVDVGGSSSRSQVEYTGAVLNDGDVVKWRHRHRNRDEVIGAWSEELTAVIKAQVGPTIAPGDTGTKLTTRTPALTLTFDGSSDGYQYRLYRAGVSIFDSGVVSISAAGSTAVTVPSGYLNWGDTIEVDAAGRPAGTGVLGPFSPVVSLYIDTLPTTSIAASDREVAGAIVPTLDVLWESPYTDPDATRYGEVPVGKELELRVAATPQGSGTLIERRTATTAAGWIVEDERTGRQLSPLTTATGWTNDTNMTASAVALAPTGYSGNSLQVAAAASASNRWSGVTLLADISDLGGGALLKVWRRVTSVTNLTRWVVILEFTGGGSLEYELATAATPVDTWEEVAIPLQGYRAKVGTPDLTALAAIRVYVIPSGSYAGNLQLRDLRVGTTRTAKDVPDGHIAAEASVDARARYRDDATHKASTTLGANSAAGATTIRLAAITGFAVGDELTIESAAGSIETRTIATLGTAGATDTVVSPAFTFAHTSGDTIKVYHWGPWTGWLTVKASVPPTVVATTPADGAVITDPTPTLVHTFASPGGKAQALRTTRLYRRRGYTARALATGPVSHWRLGEASGYVLDEIADRQNLFANPGVEAATTGITAVGGATVSRDSGFAHSGTYSFKFVGLTPGGADHNVGAQAATVPLGGPVNFSAWVYIPAASPLNGRTVSLNDEGASASTGRTGLWNVSPALAAGAWRRVGIGYTLDETATAARTVVLRYSGADQDGAVVYSDDWLAEEGVAIRPWFSGASGSGFTWDGTADLSTSRSIWGVRGSTGGGVTRGVTGLLSPADSDGAVEMAGAGYVTFGDAHGFVGLQPFSIGGWVTVDSAADMRVLDKSATGFPSGWGLKYLSTGAFAFNRSQAAVGSDTVQTTAVYPPGTYHVVVAYDGAELSLYVDGELAPGSTANPLASIKAMTHYHVDLILGRRGETGAEYLDGVADEWSVWDRAVTADEVAVLFGARLESPGDELLYELDASGTGLSDTMPALLLEHVAAYAWDKTAYDTDGLEGTTDRHGFSTLFTAPDALAGLTATPDTEASSVVLAWTASADPDLHHYRVYWRDASGEHVRVDGGPESLDDGLTPLTEATFTHHGARLGENDYLVSAHDGALESEPTATEATLSGPSTGGSWMLVSEDDDRYTLALRVLSAPRVRDASIERFAPPGRGSTVHLVWGLAGRRVSVRVQLRPTVDGDLATLLEELLASGTPVWLKAPAGWLWDPMWVVVAGLTDDPGIGGMMTISLELEETERV